MTEPTEAAPLSPEEYAWLVRVQKEGLHREENAAWERRDALRRRFHAIYPPTADRTAWHEAGHAVVAHRLGYRVLGISRSKDHEGDTRPVGPPKWSRDWNAVKVAGYLAEGRRFGEVDPWEAEEVVERFVAMEWDPAQRIAHVHAAEARADAILDAHWDAVVRIADLVRDSEWVNANNLGPALAGVGFGDAE